MQVSVLCIGENSKISTRTLSQQIGIGASLKITRHFKQTDVVWFSFNTNNLIIS